MAKVATSLFEFTPGADVEPPTDEILRALDAPRRNQELMEAICGEIDALCQRLKFLPADFRLAAAKRIARGVNSTSRAFNVAVFIAEKDELEIEDLFATQPTPMEEAELL